MNKKCKWGNAANDVDWTLHGRALKLSHDKDKKTKPIIDKIGFGGNTQWCDKIIDKTTACEKIKDLSNCEKLQECSALRQPLPAEVPFEKMIQGFKKWKEQTTTSPSGKHLGTCHILIKKYEQEKTENQKHTQEENNVATKALQTQNMLINLAIKHKHAYERWEIACNNFLKKLQVNH